MRLKAVPIERKDPARVLLTELLPFELPVFFSNEKLYRYVKNPPTNAVPSLLKALLSHEAYTIPFSFKIQRGENRSRTLAVMHPAVQIRFVPFYATWDAYILNQCSKSDFSLRQPVQVGSVYFESERRDEVPAAASGDLAPSHAVEQRVYASSYFYYARYNQVWKFFDSTEFRRLEQDFRRLLRLDVSKCFANIYTHSISWAVRGKSFAKRNKGAVSFDNEFDSLMQHANWNETNGIIVGPEISRIFAEVVLQEVDSDIKASLDAKGINEDDICLRRYVDDYFVFHNDESKALLARGVVEDALERYKLSLNEAKEERWVAPLITELSVARESVRDLLRERVVRHFDWAAYNEASEPSQHSSRVDERSADYLIKAIKGAIRTHGGTYSTVAPYALGLISRAVYRASRRLSQKHVDERKTHQIYSLLSYVLDVSFFLYRMDLRANTTYALSRILLSLVEIGDRFGNTASLLRQEIIDHGASVLRQARRAAVGECEVASLLACLFHVAGSRAVAPGELAQSLHLGRDSAAPYFAIVTALFCAADKPEYESVRALARMRTICFFERQDVDFRIDTQATLLFLDFVSCPYVDRSDKRQVIQTMARAITGRELNESDANYLRKFVEANLGFCDWQASALPLMLRRKELKPAYD